MPEDIKSLADAFRLKVQELLEADAALKEAADEWNAQANAKTFAKMVKYPNEWGPQERRNPIRDLLFRKLNGGKSEEQLQDEADRSVNMQRYEGPRDEIRQSLEPIIESLKDAATDFKIPIKPLSAFQRTWSKPDGEAALDLVDEIKTAARRAAGQENPIEPPKQLAKGDGLHETAQAIKSAIDSTPGKTADELARMVGCTAENVRRVFGKKLKEKGYTNPGGGAGYFPPSV